MNVVKKLQIVILVLLLGVPLVAQIPDGIAKSVTIGFAELSCGSSYEEYNEFLSDYSQYQLRFMYWLPFGSPCCDKALFIFNASTVDIDVLIDILNEDQRVRLVEQHSSSRIRQLAIRLAVDVDETVFLSSYAEYGLNTYGPAYNYFHFDRETKYYYFNDTVIYSGDLVDLLRNDVRVIIADYVYGWEDGCFFVIFERSVDDDARTAFFEDFSYIEFEYIAFGTMYTGKMDFILHDEAYVEILLQNDERLESAQLTQCYPFGFSTCREPKRSPTHHFVPVANNFTVYPNPVGNSDVTFKIDLGSVDVKLNPTSKIDIFNIKGQLVNSFTFEGESHVWDRKDRYNQNIPSGIYFAKVSSKNISQTKKILIIK